MVKVSVIVPVFNAERTIRACIESLRLQTLQDIECIFIDDASGDGTYKVLEEYQKKDPRVIVLHNNENIGAAASRNRGLEMAKGEYVQFVDADDYLDLEALERLYMAAEAQKAEMCYLGMQAHFESTADELRVQEGIRGKYPGLYSGKELIAQFVENKEFFLYLCSVFYNNAFIREHSLSFRNLRIGEGGDFILRALCRAEKVMVCNEKYYHYRVHESSVTHEANAKRNLLIGQIVQYADVLQYFSQHENAKELIVCLEDQHKKMAGEIQRLTADEIKQVEACLTTDYYRHVFHLLQQRSNVYGIKLDERVLSKIRKKPFLIIYGAGYASKEVIELLQIHEIEILGFAVTKRKKGQMSLYGHHIFEIQELVKYNDKSLVLVAANKIYNEDIKNTLEKYGFRDYFFLNVEI